MKFNEILRKCRVKKGITQAELARRIGIQRPYICMLENGKHSRLKLSTIRKIAKVLEVQPAPLIWMAGKTPEEVSTRRKKQAEEYFTYYLTGK